jgi:hypothetical protein
LRIGEILARRLILRGYAQQGRRRADVALRRHGEGEAADGLPTDCPYSFDQIVSQNWYPRNRHGLVDD